MRIKEKDLLQIINFIIIAFFLWQFPIIPGLMNSRRLSLIIAMGVLIVHWGRTKRTFFTMAGRTFFWSLALLVCFFIVLINGIGQERNPQWDYILPHYIVWIFLYNFIFPLYCMVIFEDVKVFATLYIAIMLIESIVVYISVINASFRLFIYYNFYGSRSVWTDVIANGSRVVGIYLAGSGGSLCFFAACMFLMYLYRSKSIKPIIFLIEYGVIMGATMFVGRLGFYLEIALLLYGLILDLRHLKNIIYALSIIAIAILVYQFILSKIGDNVARYFIQWVLEIFRKETRFRTISAINAMAVPEFSHEMIFGTNITLGITPGGAAMMSDSGIAKMYCSIGVVGALIYYFGYGSLYFPFLRETKKQKKFLWAFLILVIFVIEYKEPFFLKCTLNWQIMILMMLSKKEDMKKSKNEKVILLY